MLSKARGRAELSAIKVEKMARFTAWPVHRALRNESQARIVFHLDSRGTRQHEIGASVAVGRGRRNVRGRHPAFHAPD